MSKNLRAGSRVKAVPRARLGFLILGLAPAALLAGTLPDPSYSGTGTAGYAGFGSNTTGYLFTDGEGTTAWSGTVNGEPGSANVVFSQFGSPEPEVGASGNASNAGANASASLSYEFEVAGGGETTATPVALLFTAAATTSASGDGSAGLTIDIQSGGSIDYQWHACVDPDDSLLCGGYPDGVTLAATPLSVLTNTLYAVTLSVGAGVARYDPISGDSSPGTGAGVATIDPTFAIDPSSPNADLYTLEFSPGIGNGSGGGGSGGSVPEPGVLLLIGVGLAALGLSRRRLD